MIRLEDGNVVVDLKGVKTYECVELNLDSLKVSDGELIKAPFILSRLYYLVEENFLIIYKTDQFLESFVSKVACGDLNAYINVDVTKFSTWI